MGIRTRPSTMILGIYMLKASSDRGPRTLPPGDAVATGSISAAGLARGHVWMYVARKRMVSSSKGPGGGADRAVDVHVGNRRFHGGHNVDHVCPSRRALLGPVLPASSTV